MSLWAITEEKRIAALAAENAYWIMMERNRARVAKGDRSLVGPLDEARRHFVALEIEYVQATKAAVDSGEPHPEDAT
ncbi:MAG TPA: hypothetical protein PKA58_06240 [Polyangium sp.]|nr:hypothetical protein [Polyangium sp.]